MSSPPFAVGEKVQIRVERLAVGGAGVGRIEEFVVFVDDVAPEELVLVQISEIKKNFAFAKLINIIEASPHRRPLPCPVADRCGGCNWQHISEESQLQQKKNIVLSSLARWKIPHLSAPVTLHPSPRRLNYRNRAQLKFADGRIGYYARKTHSIVDISSCLLLEDELNAQFPAAKKWAQTQFKNLKPESPQADFKFEIRLDSNKMVSFVPLSGNSEPPAFAQVNRFQNNELILAVLEIIERIYTPIQKVVDLYCGSGNFSFPISEKISMVNKFLGVELNQSLIANAREQSQKSKSHTKFDFRIGDVEAFLRREILNNRDLIILDPPRLGCSEYTMRALAAACPDNLIYISCHPISLARDLSWFFNETIQRTKPGTHPTPDFEPIIRSIQVFEMFPQTDHVETIVHIQNCRGTHVK